MQRGKARTCSWAVRQPQPQPCAETEKERNARDQFTEVTGEASGWHNLGSCELTESRLIRGGTPRAGQSPVSVDAGSHQH